MSDNEPKMDHAYDGIEEYDNPIPAWLNLILVGSIVFSFIYFPYYHFSGMGKLPVEKYESEMAVVQAERAKEREALAAAVSPEELIQDAEVVAEGATLFGTNCASCHGASGEGDIGPDLTDRVWVNGSGTFAEIVDVITEGVVTKGMPPWGPILGPKNTQKIAAFVKTLQPPPEDTGDPEGGESPSQEPLNEEGTPGEAESADS